MLKLGQGEGMEETVASHRLEAVPNTTARDLGDGRNGGHVGEAPSCLSLVQVQPPSPPLMQWKQHPAHVGLELGGWEKWC